MGVRVSGKGEGRSGTGEATKQGEESCRPCCDDYLASDTLTLSFVPLVLHMRTSLATTHAYAHAHTKCTRTHMHASIILSYPPSSEPPPLCVTPQELLEAERDVKAALDIEPDSADLQALSKRVK